MWENLPIEEKQEYKKMMLAFASLTEVFAQKSNNSEGVESLMPIINSKYQEAVFQRAFNATAEDIGNTSFDASIRDDRTGGKYLVGIKTFGVKSDSYQKVAQFKKNMRDFTEIYEQIRQNSYFIDQFGALRRKSKESIDQANQALYLQIARSVAEIRNKRIRSSMENLKGFDVEPTKSNVKSVYHVLMPSNNSIEGPMIYVGETSYDEINVAGICCCQCTSEKNPENIFFFDGNHWYKFTHADSQLHMDFPQQEIIREKWKVIYAEDAYDVFSKIADSISEQYDYQVTDELIVPLLNKNGEAEMYSGLNSFNAMPKLGKAERQKRLVKIRDEYTGIIPEDNLTQCLTLAKEIFDDGDKTPNGTRQKRDKRDKIFWIAYWTGNMNYYRAIRNMLSRPANEVYIPIPNARQFHHDHPNFFIEGADRYTFSPKDSEEKKKELKAKNCFNLKLEPSGQIVPSKIVQSSGKAIESCKSQKYLGLWILRGVFQLSEYEVLTREKMEEVGYNTIRLYRTNKDDYVHMEFIWKD